MDIINNNNNSTNEAELLTLQTALYGAEIMAAARERNIAFNKNPFENALSSAGKKINSNSTAKVPLSSDASMKEREASLDPIFTEAAKTYGVDKALLLAIAEQESGFKADAYSKAGAQGVMQLMPSTAKALGVTDAFDPYQNIMAGANKISGLISKYNGDISLALAAYNAGSGNVSKYGGIPPFKETQNYVSKVLSNYDGYLNA